MADHGKSLWCRQRPIILHFGGGAMKRAWVKAWIIQFAEMLAICLLQAFSYCLISFIYDILLWGALPLAGMFTACQAVKRGLLNYAAWIAPPVCLYIAHMLIWGFSPPAGAALLCAFASLIGAAAGEVINQRNKRTKRQ